MEYAEDTAANKTCLWKESFLFYFPRPSRTLPPQDLRTQVSTEIYTYIYLEFRGTGGQVGLRSFLPALDGEPPPIRSMPWLRMPYSTCTKRSSRLDMTLWQVRDCLITREIK